MDTRTPSSAQKRKRSPAPSPSPTASKDAAHTAQTAQPAATPARPSPLAPRRNTRKGKSSTSSGQKWYTVCHSCSQLRASRSYYCPHCRAPKQAKAGEGSAAAARSGVSPASQTCADASRSDQNNDSDASDDAFVIRRPSQRSEASPRERFAWAECRAPASSHSHC